MDLLEGLNAQQRQAVTAPLGPVLVLAGPGSGKTRVLTTRGAYLIAEMGAAPGQILAVTFTNKAAREMLGRVTKLLGKAAAAGPAGMQIGTFHALAARTLRREAARLPFTRDFVIFDESDQEALLREVIKSLNLDPKAYAPGKMQAMISEAKAELILPEEYAPRTYVEEVVRRVYEGYQRALLQNNGLDFDDLLLWAVRLLREHEPVRDSYRRRFVHILVDEFQDTNRAQYALLRLLAGEHMEAAPGAQAWSLFAVGDADQSIYRWRGADYRYVRRFQEDYPLARVYLLEQNYRSTQTILDAAMGVIDRLAGRQRKRLFTDRGSGVPITLHEAYDEEDEARFVVETIALLVLQKQAEPGACAVMYRTNAQSRALEEAFLKAGLPYRLVGAQRFYGRREVKDVIAYLRLIHNPADEVSLLRVLNTPPRGLGARSVEALLGVARGQGKPAGEVILALARANEEADGNTFAGRAGSALREFGRLLLQWIEWRGTSGVPALIDRVLADVRYREFIDDGTEEGAERWNNVLELRGVAEEFPEADLTGFLEQVALVSDQDTLTEAQNAPTLLTLHAAKGLEFPVVFLVGLDDGVLPHQRSFGDPEAMAEERRLFYVGITRAMDRLFLLRSFRRRLVGSSTVTAPSRFLDDIPADVIEGDRIVRPLRERAAYARQTRWESPVEAAVEPRFRAGMRVVHPSFGEGIVLETRVDRDDEEVTVAFETAGIKRLAGSIAPLKPVDSGQ